ncbi:MAG: Clp1/GlmU family protein [Candidatus Nitrosocosmicus sp.]
MVKGPISMKVRGECEILGVKFRNTFIIYQNNKYLPIEKNTDTIISLKKGKNYFNLEKNSKYGQDQIGTNIWGSIIECILNANRKRIIIIGPSDTGKSTLTLFIANKLLNKGLRPLIIDSDIGQGELSPPTCIGATILNEQTIDLARVNPYYVNFIGDIQPIGYESRIINCIKKSYDKLNKNNNLTIINTDGFVNNNESNYKMDLIKKIDPDCIICMRENNQTIDLFDIIREEFSGNSNIKIIQGQAPHKEIRKTSYDRRVKRLIKYSNLLKTFTKKVFISKHKVIAIYYQNSFFLSERNTETEKINGIGSKDKIIKDLLNNRNFVRNRFVGLSLKEDYEKITGFGILKEFNKGFFMIQSSINKFDNLFISDIKLYSDSTSLFK